MKSSNNFHKKLWIWLVALYIALNIIFLLLVHFLSPSTVSEISADGMLEFIVTGLSGLATMALSVVAVWQTQRANEQTDKANALAEKANEQTKIANDLAIKANEQTERANQIAEKEIELNNQLAGLEKRRYILDTRPFAMVVGWKLRRKNFSELYLDANRGLNIQIGKCDDHDLAYSLDIEFQNTTNSTITVAFSECYSEDGSVKWEYSVGNYPYMRLYLKAGESKRIGFYAKKEEFIRLTKSNLIMELNLQNRLAESYREKLEILIHPDFIDDHQPDVFCTVYPQHYQVGKFVDDNNIVWEEKNFLEIL